MPTIKEILAVDIKILIGAGIIIVLLICLQEYICMNKKNKYSFILPIIVLLVGLNLGALYVFDPNHIDSTFSYVLRMISSMIFFNIPTILLVAVRQYHLFKKRMDDAYKEVPEISEGETR